MQRRLTSSAVCEFAPRRFYSCNESPVRRAAPQHLEVMAKVRKGPTVTDAAPCTFLHEGRKPDFRCALHRGPLSGTKRPFAAAADASAEIACMCSTWIPTTQRFPQTGHLMCLEFRTPSRFCVWLANSNCGGSNPSGDPVSLAALIGVNHVRRSNGTCAIASRSRIAFVTEMMFTKLNAATTGTE
jgi:hypothetical protein